MKQEMEENVTFWNRRYQISNNCCFVVLNFMCGELQGSTINSMCNTINWDSQGLPTLPAWRTPWS